MLYRKLYRELWKQRTQFFAIFMMSFLGFMVYAGMNAEHTGGTYSAMRYYKETNLADYWVKGKYFSEDDRKMLEKLDEINTVQRCFVTEGTVPSFETEQDEVVMIVQFVDDNQISMPQIIEGEVFSAEKKGIWIGQLFAETKKLSVGEEMTIEIGQETITQPIRGIIRAPEYVYYTSGRNEIVPDYGAFGYAFMPGSCYPNAEELKIYDILQIDVKDERNIEKEYFKEKLKTVLDIEDLLVTDRTQNNSYETFKAEMEQHFVFSFLFPAVFLMIALLGIVTTMTRMTANQRVQIGTMKALGFSNKTILLHYISFGGIVSLAGAVWGTLGGYYLLAPLILKSLMDVYQLPEWEIVLSGEIYVAIILVTLLATGVCYLACRKELSEAPARALRPKTPKQIRGIWIEKSFIWKQMDFALQWTLRDIRKNKLRTMMGVLGAAGCMMLLVSAFGCMDSIAYMPEEIYEHMELGCQTIFFEEGTDAFTVGEYAKKYAGQEIQVCAIELEGINENGNSGAENGNITVVGEGNLMHYIDVHGKEIFLEKQDVMLTRKMAELLHVREGDMVRLRILGNDKMKNLRVTKIYRNPSVQGITLSKELFEKLEYDFQPGKILTNRILSPKITEETSVKSVMSSEQQWSDMLLTMETMSTIVYLLGAAAVILGLVVLYNLSELSFVEKIREYATLKALGMENSVIQRIIAYQNFVIGGSGVVLGVPLGNRLLGYMFASMGDGMDMSAVITQKSYIGSAAITLGVVWFSCMLMSFKMKNINMIDSLKGVE